MAKSAIAPSGTGRFTPFSAPFDAVSLIACGDGLPLPSNSASVPIASPAAIFGSHFCFCASLPASIKASAARYTVEENGTGASARPISSAMTQSSRLPAPAPRGDNANPEMPRPRPAVAFRNRDPEKAHFRKALPQFLVIAGLAIEHFAHRLRRAFLGEILPRL